MIYKTNQTNCQIKPGGRQWSALRKDAMCIRIWNGDRFRMMVSKHGLMYALVFSRQNLHCVAPQTWNCNTVHAPTNWWCLWWGLIEWAQELFTCSHLEVPVIAKSSRDWKSRSLCHQTRILRGILAPLSALSQGHIFRVVDSRYQNKVSTLVGLEFRGFEPVFCFYMEVPSHPTRTLHSILVPGGKTIDFINQAFTTDESSESIVDLR